MRWFLANDFIASRLLDNGTMEQKMFTSAAQARQFVEQENGEVLAHPVVAPEDTSKRVRLNKEGKSVAGPEDEFKFPGLN